MPWFINEKNCIIAGTRDDPGDEVKCHDSKEAAVAHLQALFANMPESEKEFADAFSEFYSFQDDGRDRWLCISTMALKDNDGETYTKEAIDFGIEWVTQTGEFPELRVLHIRGLKAGKADKMSRIGPFAVDEGFYLDDALGKETRRVVNSSTMKVSRGFSVVEATGMCPTCGTRLRVGPIGLRFALQCGACDSLHLGRSLKDLHFTKAIPFDLTVTDRPAVPLTVIVNKENEMSMTRDQIKERLVEAGFTDTIVGPIVDALPDEDLERMKDDTLVQQFKELIETAIPESVKEGATDDDDEDPKTVTPGEDGIFKCLKCGNRMRMQLGTRKEDGDREIEIGEELVGVIAQAVAAQLKEGFMPEAMEIEIPGLVEHFGKVEEKIKEVKDALIELAKSEAEKLATFNKDLSDASRTRLTYRLRTKESPKAQAAMPETEPGKTDLILPNPDGSTAHSMSEFMGLGGGVE